MEEDTPLPVIVKVIVIGERGVGKSSLLKRWLEDGFNVNQQSTVGVDFKVRTFKSNISNRRFKLQVWDLSGHDRFLETNSTYSANTSVFVFVFDVCNKTSFEQIPIKWFQIALWKKNEETKVFRNTQNEHASAYLIGNKIDKATEERQVTEVEANNFARAHNMRYCEMSAMTGAHVVEEFQLIVDCIDSYDRSWEKEVGRPVHSTDYILLDEDDKKKKYKKRCCFYSLFYLSIILFKHFAFFPDNPTHLKTSLKLPEIIF
jgi:small GTP-binding protein